MMILRLSLAVFLCLACLCERGAFAQSVAPRPWDAGIDLVEAKDLNPAADVIEINLTARVASVEVAPGTRVTAWTYDGGLPGPLIRARVGNRLIVHFKNELPEPTTVHWHGVRVPIEMDGVPGISQPDVKPGESFTYDFVLKDASLYWYHPHVMSAAQVGFGLYGALLVEDPADGVDVSDQLTIVLSDIGFDDKGVLEPADSGGPAGMVFGREGAHVLVNGKVKPTLRARSGVVQRWRIVNAAKSRFFFLDLGGQPFLKLGVDGGFQEKAIETTELLITPGERVDVLVAPVGKANESITVQAMLYNRGYGSVEYRNVEDLFTILVEPQMTQIAQIKKTGAVSALLKKAASAVRPTIVPPRATGAAPINLVLTLPPQDPSGHSEFRVNGVPHWKAKPYKAKLGETQLWTIRNETKWDHPMHLHGYFFMPVDEKGQPQRPMRWKDTINIPMETTARFLVTFDERPGEWMFHCHILDHADGGLMGTILVGDVTSKHSHLK